MIKPTDLPIVENTKLFASILPAVWYKVAEWTARDSKMALIIVPKPWQLCRQNLVTGVCMREKGKTREQLLVLPSRAGDRLEQ